MDLANTISIANISTHVSVNALSGDSNLPRPVSPAKSSDSSTTMDTIVEAMMVMDEDEANDMPGDVSVSEVNVASELKCAFLFGLKKII
jgi:hypothetical protein